MVKKDRRYGLVKWEPIMSDLVSFKKSIDQQFENFFSGHPFIARLPVVFRKELTGWKPAIDMYETGNSVIVEADISGCDKKDVDIKVDNNILTISGEKKEEKEIKSRNFYQKERHMGSFTRQVSLPNYADIGKPRATYEKGTLRVVFPKTELAHIKHKKIEISEK